MTSAYASELARAERALGPPTDDGVFGWAAAVRRDDTGGVPEDALAWFHGLGLCDVQVPEALGGSLQSLEQLLAVSRAVARRDPALAVACGMQTWSQLAWMFGSASQQAVVREVVRSGQPLALAVSEREHGADLGATEVTAFGNRDGRRLNGRKWPIGMAARAPVVFVLARSRQQPGPSALSWFLVDRRRVPAGSLTAHGDLPTLGLRSSGLGELVFTDTPVSDDDRIGGEGQGLPSTLKLFQVTRALLGGIALGSADTALRLAASFIVGRHLYGKPAADLPVVRDQLVTARVDLVIAEVLSLVTVRGIHERPEQASVSSLIAKVIVPELTGNTLRVSAELLGARHYLRTGYASGIFQKLLRDHAALPLFDGSTPVCLGGLAMQLEALLDACGSRTAERTVPVGDLSMAVPPVDASRLELFARGVDDVVQGISGLDPGIVLRAARPDVADGVSARIRDLRAALATLIENAARERRDDSRVFRGPLGMALAHRYARLHAACACVHVAVANAADSDVGLDASLLLACLERLLAPERPLAARLSGAHHAALFDGVVASITRPRLFSIVPLPLEESRPHDAW